MLVFANNIKQLTPTFNTNPNVALQITFVLVNALKCI